MKHKMMKQKLLCVLLATVLCPVSVLSEEYALYLIDVQVTSENCHDLSVIEGISGKVSYNHETQTLTLENASIVTKEKEEPGVCILNDGIEQLTIELIGENRLIAEQSTAIVNFDATAVTITGNGRLHVSAYASNEMGYCGIMNWGDLLIKDCEINLSGDHGIYGGFITIDNATVRAKGVEDFGSICDYGELNLVNCKITAPANAVIGTYQFNGYEKNGIVCNGVVTAEEVVIMPDAVGITNTASSTEQTFAKSVFDIDGRRTETCRRGVNIVRTADGHFKKVMTR